MAQKLTNKQREQNWRQDILQRQQEVMVKHWTQQQGFSTQALTAESIELLQATKIAKNILFDLAQYTTITREQIQQLQTFIKRSGYRSNRPTLKNCMAIFILAKTLKRKKVRQAVT